MDPLLPGAIRDVASSLGMDPGWLDAIIYFESNYSPSVVNKIGATGLIQFLPSTAAQLGTTTAQLAQMSAVQQMEYVRRYFAPYAGRLQSLEDAYMAVLWPAGIGKPLDAVLWSKNDPKTRVYYNANANLDRNGDGVITKREAASIVVSYYRPQTSIISVAPPQASTTPEEVATIAPASAPAGEDEETNTGLVAGIGIVILVLGYLFSKS